MTYPSDDELLSAYLDGELSAEEALRVERLIREQPRLQRLQDEFKQMRASLQRLPRMSLPADFADQVLRRAADSSPHVHDPGSPVNPVAARHDIAAPNDVAAPDVIAAQNEHAAAGSLLTQYPTLHGGGIESGNGIGRGEALRRWSMRPDSAAASSESPVILSIGQRRRRWIQAALAAAVVLVAAVLNFSLPGGRTVADRSIPRETDSRALPAGPPRSAALEKGIDAENTSASAPVNELSRETSRLLITKNPGENVPLELKKMDAAGGTADHKAGLAVKGADENPDLGLGRPRDNFADQENDQWDEGDSKSDFMYKGGDPSGQEESDVEQLSNFVQLDELPVALHDFASNQVIVNFDAMNEEEGRAAFEQVLNQNAITVQEVETVDGEVLENNTEPAAGEQPEGEGLSKGMAATDTPATDTAGKLDTPDKKSQDNDKVAEHVGQKGETFSKSESSDLSKMAAPESIDGAAKTNGPALTDDTVPHDDTVQTEGTAPTNSTVSYAWVVRGTPEQIANTLQALSDDNQNFRSFSVQTPEQLSPADQQIPWTRFYRNQGQQNGADVAGQLMGRGIRGGGMGGGGMGGMGGGGGGAGGMSAGGMGGAGPGGGAGSPNADKHRNKGRPPVPFDQTAEKEKDAKRVYTDSTEEDLADLQSAKEKSTRKQAPSKARSDSSLGDDPKTAPFNADNTDSDGTDSDNMQSEITAKDVAEDGLNESGVAENKVAGDKASEDKTIDDTANDEPAHDSKIAEHTKAKTSNSKNKSANSAEQISPKAAQHDTDDTPSHGEESPESANVRPDSPKMQGGRSRQDGLEPSTTSGLEADGNYAESQQRMMDRIQSLPTNSALRMRIMQEPQQGNYRFGEPGVNAKLGDENADAAQRKSDRAAAGFRAQTQNRSRAPRQGMGRTAEQNRNVRRANSSREKAAKQSAVGEKSGETPEEISVLFLLRTSPEAMMQSAGQTMQEMLPGPAGPGGPAAKASEPAPEGDAPKEGNSSP